MSKTKNSLNKLKFAIAAGLALIVAAATPLAAQANTPVNSFSATGQSWVDVPSGDRTYFEPFGSPNYSYYYDDRALLYIPTGITCAYNSVTATGPMYVGSDVLSSSDCHDGSSNPYDPENNNTNSAPFGFTINFFGTNYSSAWPNTNGGVFMDGPSNRYNSSVSSLVANSHSTAIFPLSTDQQYSYGESNFWTGNTTINGHNAFVMSWEKFVNNGTETGSAVNMSYQLVLINQGNGDFDAWFNYDSLTGATGGYDAPVAWIDLQTDVTVGSNIVHTADAKYFPAECTDISTNDYGTATDTTSADFWYVKKVTDSTLSLWTDNSCTTPANAGVAQNVSADGYAYIEVTGPEDYSSVTAGWGLYNSTNGKVSWTELLRNLDRDTLFNAGSTPLISTNWNTTVPGRFVLNQRGGVVSDGSNGNGGSTGDGGSLAATGGTLEGTIILMILLLVVGVSLKAASGRLKK